MERNDSQRLVRQWLGRNGTALAPTLPTRETAHASEPVGHGRKAGARQRTTTRRYAVGKAINREATKCGSGSRTK